MTPIQQEAHEFLMARSDLNFWEHAPCKCKQTIPQCHARQRKFGRCEHDCPHQLEGARKRDPGKKGYDSTRGDPKWLTEQLEKEVMEHEKG